jgi:Fic family protein
LITLYLVSHGLLSKPSLYLSAHLEKHRGAYYDALTRVRESNDIGHWVRFFLQAVVETAESGKRTFQRILTLRQELDAEILKLGRRAENAQQLMLYLYGTPTITVNKAMAVLGINYVPANSLIASLVDMGVLHEVTGFQRNRIFILRRYIDIFRDGN